MSETTNYWNAPRGTTMYACKDGEYVSRDDYARLEQECERWKETAAGLDRQNDAIADEVAGAIKRAERLRGLLMEISKSEGRGVDWAQEIDAALSAKP